MQTTYETNSNSLHKTIVSLFISSQLLIPFTSKLQNLSIIKQSCIKQSALQNNVSLS